MGEPKEKVMSEKQTETSGEAYRRIVCIPDGHWIISVTKDGETKQICTKCRDWIDYNVNYRRKYLVDFFSVN
jgi:hypothetical protein